MFRFFPWRYFVKHAAKRYGVLDPAMLLAKLRQFSQPSEVAEPLELLRAGIIFHARGLVNVKAIQHNLDWVWPYWVERQFNPADPSFIPRGFSFSHINVTHRNWTAVGVPSRQQYPIIDPRGLVTPLYDGWSLDFWVVTRGGRKLLPSKLRGDEVSQQLEFHPNLTVATDCHREGMDLALHTACVSNGIDLSAETRVRALSADEDGWLVVAIRPYNPEGVQFIHRITFDPDGKGFHVNGAGRVLLDTAPEAVRMAHYGDGDVIHDLDPGSHQHDISCRVGMATAAAMIPLRAGEVKHVTVRVPLPDDEGKVEAVPATDGGWAAALEGVAKLAIGDARMQFLYDAAVRSLLLLSSGPFFPGPYTYRRFWFRDASLMLHPLLAIGLKDRSERILGGFAARQTMTGHFLSQEGEWDSNGQVLWIAARHAAMTGRALDPAFDAALRKAVRWLDHKRLPAHHQPPGTGGLLPAGFSAEHLGPNDYYYWDDYWAWGGLEAIAGYWEARGEKEMAATARKLAAEYGGSIELSLAGIPANRSRGAIPAAPGRRMDAGAIGSCVAGYPLQLSGPDDSRMRKTVDYLVDHCFHRGGFFQEMIHSGVNAYLTLALAQWMLRCGDERFAELMRTVADIASPTGQWPEAIHPITGGGCMGDGHHGWAAAEWVMMVRNCFLREEEKEGVLVIGSGLLPEWIRGGVRAAFGPGPTAWGDVSVEVENGTVKVDAAWRGAPPRMRVAVPGYAVIDNAEAGREYHLQQISQ